MKYVYQKQIDGLETCPPEEYHSKTCNCFRWVFEKMDDERNFLAQAEKNPKSLNDKTDLQKCENYALSFHDTIENSQAHFIKLTKRFKNIKKLLGTHIAQGTLRKKDGVGGQIERNGHFNFHHTEESNFNKRFKIIRTLQ
ncbi:hypothetical protein [Salinimicrobium sp. TH3]|uniref:hypothetical protein n=1 Tax=Salinimicrobium sp. TH3 TaxID=2997342 RepID=UPI002274DD3F|nr:hypothetical protein [Salinimicrobium sp. TH3]MCY2687580.1 hypothetical protein [Salinimicrobium sp. TH3]